MFCLNENCCICLSNTQSVRRLSELDYDKITFYIKLTSSVPEICFDGLNDQFMICDECESLLIMLYNFRQKCLEVKKLTNFESCCICLVNKQCKRFLSDTQLGGVSVFNKIKLCIPEMTNESINNEKRICETCCDILNVVYNFRKKCVRNKSILIGYVSKLNSVNDSNKNNESCYQENIVIKEEFVKNDDENYDDNQINVIRSKINTDVTNTSSCYTVGWSKGKCCDTVIKLEDNAATERGDTTLRNVKSEDNELYTTECVVKRSSGRNDSCKAVEMVPKSHIKTEEAEVNIDDDVASLEGNVEHPFAFVSVNNRNTDKFYETKLEESDMELGERSENGRSSSGKCNMVYNVVKWEDSGVVVKSELGDVSEGSNDGLRSTGDSDEITIEENEVKREEIGANEPGVSSEGYNTSLRVKEELQTIRRDSNAKQLLEKQYKCTICSKNATSQDTLKKHMGTHAGIRPHECNICDKKFAQSNLLKIHMAVHTGKMTHECNVCNKKFTQGHSLNTHMSIHTGEKPHECNICEKKFTQLHSLKTHMVIHTGERPHECSTCSKKFAQRTTLKAHMVIHTGEKRHECNVCNKKFGYLGHLKTHMLLHTEEKSHECNICNKKYSNVILLNKHMVIHTGEKPHACNICNKKFVRLKSLKGHMLTHTEENLHECDICNKKFSRVNSFKVHMAAHTGERTHECKICNKKFMRFCHLTTHMVVHTEDRPHKCTVCKKQFTRLSHLKTHMFVHTGEKPHECSVCGKKFALLGTLKTHMSTHTGKMPHECDVCNKRFMRQSLLKAHMKIHSVDVVSST